MKKLELKDIACYLPYELKFINKDGIVLRMDALQARGYHVWAHQRYFKGINDKSDINYAYLNSLNCSGKGEYLRRIKPILRPMSDLVNPITIKGYNKDKEFIPLLELAKYDTGNEGIGYTLERDPDPNDSHYFVKYKIYKDSQEWHYYSFCEDIRYSSSASLWELDFLNQWMFDYRRLINEGLAIDINTLKL